ncbi:hypothetical protein LUZ60_002146 [Juncus effusus]|nr:hypothetical protein LUZ60_002146 [Juncus effusus]
MAPVRPRLLRRPFLTLIFLSSLSLFLLYFLFPSSSSSPLPSASLSAHHLLFGIASSQRSLLARLPYLSLWWDPSIRLFVFLDSLPDLFRRDRFPVPVVISDDTSKFPYSFKGGLKSAVRGARIIKELIDRPDISKKDIRWVILGDDDTVFVMQNLLETLEKYDWREWHYIGGRSEMWEQNVKHGFNMAYGGAGIAISYPLARVLARVLDSCLQRYPHLFGSDGRLSACLAELGVELTYEPGFHQIDMHGDISGLLGTHSLSPLISLHHFDQVNPLFPFLNRSASLHHLFKSIKTDPLRAFQQSVCYDRKNNLTISISWGYSVQIYEGNMLLLDVLSVEKTFLPWRRGRNGTETYLFNTRESLNRRGEKCKRAVFFLSEVARVGERVETRYRREMKGKCLMSKGLTVRNLRLIRVRSWKLKRIKGKTLRRHCCDVLPSSNEFMINIDIRECKDGELIAMQT